MFGPFLNMKLVFNGLLCHYILLREVKDKQDVVILIKLLDQKVFFGWKNFYTSTRLRARSTRPMQFEEDKARRLKHLYLGDQSNMNGSKLDKDYLRAKRMP